MKFLHSRRGLAVCSQAIHCLRKRGRLDEKTLGTMLNYCLMLISNNLLIINSFRVNDRDPVDGSYSQAVEEIWEITLKFGLKLAL